MAGTYICQLVHFVWSTKERRPFISDEWRDSLHATLGGILRNKRGKLLCAGGMPEHIHLLASLPSTISLAAIVNALKANSTGWIHDAVDGMQVFCWQAGYAAFSVSKSAEEAVTRYIQNQAVHHQKRDFKAELLALLEKHRIEYDERYLWD